MCKVFPNNCCFTHCFSEKIIFEQFVNNREMICIPLWFVMFRENKIRIFASLILKGIYLTIRIKWWYLFPHCFLIFISLQKPTDCKNHLSTALAFVGDSFQEELLRCLWEFASVRIIDLMKVLFNQILRVYIIGLICTYNIPKKRIIEVFLRNRKILVYENILCIYRLCIISRHWDYPLFNKYVKIIKEPLDSLALLWIALFKLLRH